jgi:AcrR family transcriptional regulator
MSSDDRTPLKRRVPQQQRSRGRVAKILEATAQLVLSQGVEAVNTRAIAASAGIPVASLYQYFADKEEVLLALVQRDLAQIDEMVAEHLARLPVLTVRSMVETSMRAHAEVYRRCPAFVVIWLRGRTNARINDFCREHNRRVAGDLFKVACEFGMVDDPDTGLYVELATEVGDRLFQVAFEDSFEGDCRVIEETIAFVTSYLEKHCTAIGISGVPNPAAEEVVPDPSGPRP